MHRVSFASRYMEIFRYFNSSIYNLIFMLCSERPLVTDHLPKRAQPQMIPALHIIELSQGAVEDYIYRGFSLDTACTQFVESIECRASCLRTTPWHISRWSEPNAVTKPHAVTSVTRGWPILDRKALLLMLANLTGTVLRRGAPANWENG